MAFRRYPPRNKFTLDMTFIRRVQGVITINYCEFLGNYSKQWNIAELLSPRRTILLFTQSATTEIEQ